MKGKTLRKKVLTPEWKRHQIEHQASVADIRASCVIQLSLNQFQSCWRNNLFDHQFDTHTIP